jgi:hypothetical protein
MQRAILGKVLLVVIGAVALINGEDDTQGGVPDVEDYKCPACDFAVQAWFHQAILVDLACGRFVDDQLRLHVLRRVPFPDSFNRSIDCNEENVVTQGAIEGLASELCQTTLLDVFPYVEEFDQSTPPADNDRETNFDDEPEYFDQRADVPAMDPQHKALIVTSCRQSLGVGNLKKRLAATRHIAAALSQVAAPDLDTRLKKKHASDLAAINTAQVGEGNDRIEPAVLNERFLRSKKREVVYGQLLTLQKQLCGAACGQGLSRPTFERRVRGWAPSLKRL